MLLLIAGLIVFLGLHSSRIFFSGARDAAIARMGAGGWKGLYSVLSLAGFVMIVYGYSQARLEPSLLWVPPTWTRHLAALLTLPAFIMVVAAYVPGNAIKAKLKHPMLLGTKLWAAAHLLANGMLADALLFGGFLVWAILCFRAARMRDRAAGTSYVSTSAVPTVITVVVGIAAWAAFAMWLHVWLIGVKPFG
jgi:uncharacterized membrane protein